MEDKRFHTVDQILSYAFAAEAARITPEMSYELMSRVTNPEALSPEEFIADGIMLKNRAMRNLVSLQRNIISLWYRKPVDRGLQDMIAFNLYCLTLAILDEKKQPLDRFFVVDVLREWSPYNKSHHGLVWWSEHLGKPLGTVKSWALSNDPDRKSINYLLNTWLNDARQQLEVVYADAGLL